MQGKYLFKLLAVDVPSAAGPEQRLYLEGDEKAYARGGVIAELRDPFLHVPSTARPDPKSQAVLVYLKYWILNLNPLRVCIYAPLHAQILNPKLSWSTLSTGS